MKPIRIAFSGSGFKFPAHVGALQAVIDAGYTPIEYAGTSGGSLIAALAAAGMDVQRMRALSMDQDWSDMLSFSLKAFLGCRTFCDGRALLDWLTDKTAGRTFADLDADLTIMSSDINHGEPFRWSRETTPEAPIALAARASAAIPVIYSPVLYDDITHQDGGMANNIPVMRLQQDLVLRLGIDLTVKSAPLPPGTIDTFALVARDIELMLNSNENTQILMGKASGALVAYVETGYASGLDRNMARGVRQRLLNDGYAAVKAILPG